LTYLLDSSVLIDTLNDRNGRPQLLSQLSQQDILLACCAVNITEVYMGMRPSEEARTGRFLRSLEFYPVTWDIAQLAGDLFREWRQKGQTLCFADVTIAAVALTYKLVLITDDQKHFPMRNLHLFQLPEAEKRKSVKPAPKK
jgi:predicted nucleic acid-binding protein